MAIDVGKVGMVPVSSIIVGDRARKELGDLSETEENMKEIGLTTPLTFKANSDGTFHLLAGERRLTILIKNGNTEVPGRIYERDLTPIEMKIIEKSENFFRKEMEYYEMDQLILDIDRMQKELHGEKASGPGSTGWSSADTGAMIAGGLSKASVSLAIKRATMREACPAAFESCKSAADALKMIKKVEEAVVTQVLAKKIEETKDNHSVLNQLMKSFIIGNTFEEIKKVPAGVFHLVEIDPPYAIKLMDKKKSDGESQYTENDYNEIPSKIYIEGDKSSGWLGMRYLLKECYRVMSDHSWLLCWFGPEPWFETIYNEIVKAGFETTRMCPLWTKPSGQTMQPGIYLPNAYEMFFYAWKGRPAIARPRGTNIFNYSPVPSQQKTHPTERPVEMMKDIYETFAFAGSRVLIPFLGSGSGLIAAHQAGMTGVGFELSKSYKDSFIVKANGMK